MSHIMEQTWQGKWIWKKDSKDSHSKTEILYFRRVFDVPQEECSLVIHVSADSRYQLFFNGEPILVGPCKGDRYSHYYETIDLSDRLQKGRKNILAAKVIHFPLSQPYRLGDGPVSVWRSASGGFLLEGSLFSMQGNLVESIHTDESWRCLQDESLHFVMESWLSNFLGGVERVDGSKIPHGWHLEDFNDLHWSQAQIVANISNGYGILSPWQLEKRPIPLLFEKDKVFKRVMRSNHSIPLSEIEEENFYQQKQEAGQEVDQQKQMKAKEEDMYRQSKKQEKASSITIAAHSTYEVELDAGLLTTGYLRFSCSGGKGSKVSILCAECYEAEELEPGKRNKGVRDDFSQGKFLRGDSDVYQVAGIGKADVQQYETYEPFFFKTFRFVQLKIEVAEEPLQLHHFHYRETGYPLDVKGSFRSSDRSLDPLWEISINTLQRCMHETYEDCPYYEQLQYIMDTRLQILFTYYLSGDDRLARKAMKDFHNSLLPSGMLQSRYPSIDPQVIPGFSLYWIAMVYDHYNYFADEALAKSYLHTIDAILGWFESYRKPAGIVGEMPAKYWNFVDWVEEWKDTSGIPTAGIDGPITVYSMIYSTALQQAAQLNEWLGRKDTAWEYRDRVVQINAALQKECWSEERGLFRDGPSVEEYSQHAQLWAVLAEVVTGDQAQELMKRTLEEKNLAKVSYAMSFFLFRALQKAGVYEKSFSLWDTWREMVQLNLTTWVEDPVGQRSDCHAWGSVPLYDFPAEILGVKPLEPGFSKVLIEPQLGHLKYAEGKVPTPIGDIKVRWEIIGARFQIQIEAPTEVELHLQLPDGSVKMYQASPLIKAACSLKNDKNYID